MLPPCHNAHHHQNHTNRKSKELEQLIRIGALADALHGVGPQVAQWPRVLGLLAGDITVRPLIRVVVILGLTALVQERVAVERLQAGLDALGALHAHGPGDSAGEEEEGGEAVCDEGDEGGDELEEVGS